MIKILVAEDDKSLNSLVCSYLNDNGYAYKACYDGKQALSAMENEAFDLIISDVMMPELDGFAFAAKVRENDKRIPILFMTALDDKPVRAVLEATDKIAAGDFSTRLEVRHSFNRYDEYDYIMENFNKMAAELARTEVLHTDFISNVSHEIKTPLAVIRNYAASLQNKSLDDRTRIKYAQTLVDASKRLTALITNILMLNKLENQQIKPEYEKINLTETLAETVLGFEELIESKGLEIECDLEEGVEAVSLPSYLEIVWNNLLSNAVKFTVKGGKITVSLKSGGGQAVVTLVYSVYTIIIFVPELKRKITAKLKANKFTANVLDDYDLA